MQLGTESRSPDLCLLQAALVAFRSVAAFSPFLHRLASSELLPAEARNPLATTLPSWQGAGAGDGKSEEGRGLHEVNDSW